MPYHLQDIYIYNSFALKYISQYKLMEQKTTSYFQLVIDFCHLIMSKSKFQFIFFLFIKNTETKSNKLYNRTNFQFPQSSFTKSFNYTRIIHYNFNFHTILYRNPVYHS